MDSKEIQVLLDHCRFVCRCGNRIHPTFEQRIICGAESCGEQWDLEIAFDDVFLIRHSDGLKRKVQDCIL